MRQFAPPNFIEPEIYNGFCPFTGTQHIDRVAVVKIGDKVEVWELDLAWDDELKRHNCAAALSQLEQYYQDRHFRAAVTAEWSGMVPIVPEKVPIKVFRGYGD